MLSHTLFELLTQPNRGNTPAATAGIRLLPGISAASIGRYPSLLACQSSDLGGWGVLLRRVAMSGFFFAATQDDLPRGKAYGRIEAHDGIGSGYISNVALEDNNRIGRSRVREHLRKE